MMPQVPNKLASIFIVGALALVILWVHFDEQLLDMIHLERVGAATESPKSTIPAVIPMTFGLLSMAGLAGVLGATIQGFASIFVRPWFQRCSDGDNMCKWFGKSKERREALHWATHYRACAQESRYKKAYEAEGGPDSVGNWRHPFSPLASALFFKKEAPHMTWVLQHYATYYLVTDLALVALGSFALGGLLWGPSWVTNGAWFQLGLFFAVHLAVVYGLLSTALHRYLYTYNSALRHGYLMLLEEQEQREDSAQPEGSSEPPPSVSEP